LPAVNALETEKHIVQRAIVMVFSEFSRQAGAALVSRAAGDGESTNAFARTVWGLFGQVSVNDRRVHNLFFGLSCVVEIIFYFVACEWASTNQSHLSMPREASVNRSAASPCRWNSRSSHLSSVDWISWIKITAKSEKYF
jgi:hypothetical protein